MRFPKLTILLLLLICGSVMAQFGADENLVDMKLVSSFDKAHAGTEVMVAAKLHILEGWHINSNKPKEEFLIPTEIKVKGDTPFVIKEVKYPEPQDIKFDFSDNPVSVYEKEVLIGLLVLLPEELDHGEHQLNLELEYQACNNANCMPPVRLSKELKITIVDKSTPVSEINSEVFSKLKIQKAPQEKDEEDSVATALESSGLAVGLILVFLWGLALNLTPCVYPLIPITIGYFGGQSEGSTGKLFVLGSLYVLGLALTYSIVGVITAMSGAVFGTLMQNPIVILLIVGIFIALSLSMFGLYELKMPDKLVMKAGGARSGAMGAFFMGLTMGIVAAPCIGPVVLGLVTYVAAKGDPFFGFLMFFFLALGLGFPYLLLALFSGKIKSLPRAGMWMEAVKHIFGILLLGMALYFLMPLIPKSIVPFVLPVFMIISAIYLIFFEKKADNILGFRIFKIVFSVAIFGIAVYALIPKETNTLAWNKYSDVAYQEALDSNEKIIIDFYADWCIPCKELDALTFSDASVIETSKSFKAFKVDMTKTMSENTEKIRDKFGIVGMPTILILNSEGNEVKRLTGFINAKEFEDILSRIN